MTKAEARRRRINARNAAIDAAWGDAPEPTHQGNVFASYALMRGRGTGFLVQRQGEKLDERVGETVRHQHFEGASMAGSFAPTRRAPLPKGTRKAPKNTQAENAHEVLAWRTKVGGADPKTGQVKLASW